MAGEQRLVGGDHRAADLERAADGGQSRAVLAADQLDEEVDGVRLGEGHGVVEPLQARHVDAAVLGPRARAHRGDDHRAAELAGELGALLLQDAHQRGADVAEPGDADAERRGGGRLGLLLHGLEDAGAGVAARLAALAQVEDEQRIARDLRGRSGSASSRARR